MYRHLFFMYNCKQNGTNLINNNLFIFLLITEQLAIYVLKKGRLVSVVVFKVFSVF